MVVCYKRNVEYVDNPESAAVHCGAVRGSRGQWRAAAGSGGQRRACGSTRGGSGASGCNLIFPGGSLALCRRLIAYVPAGRSRARHIILSSGYRLRPHDRY